MEHKSAHAQHYYTLASYYNIISDQKKKFVGYSNEASVESNTSDFDH